MSWTILEAGTVALDPTTLQADVRLSGDGTPQAVADLVERIGEAPVREGLRARLAGSEAVARYGRLRAEAAGLEREASVIGATLARKRAEREETVTVAAVGFAKRLPDLDGQISDLQRQQAEATAAKKSIVKLVADARQAAHAEATRAADGLNRAVASEAHGLRLQILARLSEAIGPLLSELAGVEQIMAASAFKSLGGDVGAVVEEAAKAAAVTKQPATIAPC
jgi:hypothetical protein